MTSYARKTNLTKHHRQCHMLSAKSQKALGSALVWHTYIDYQYPLHEKYLSSTSTTSPKVTSFNNNTYVSQSLTYNNYSQNNKSCDRECCMNPGINDRQQILNYYYPRATSLSSTLQFPSTRSYQKPIPPQHVSQPTYSAPQQDIHSILSSPISPTLTSTISCSSSALPTPISSPTSSIPSILQLQKSRELFFDYF